MNKIIELLEIEDGLSFQEIAEKLNIEEDKLAKEIKEIENVSIYKEGKKYYLAKEDKSFGLIVYKNKNPYIKNNDGKLYKIDVNYTTHKPFYNDRFMFSLDDRDKASLLRFVSHNPFTILAITSKDKGEYRLFRPYDTNLDLENLKVYDSHDVNTYDLALIDVSYDKTGINAHFKAKVDVNNINDADVVNLIYASGVNFTFDADYMKEVENIPDMVSKEELKDRVDYSNDLVFTIDGDDSKDFDDAISLKKVDNGYLLNVHIADVSHYVKENTLIDKEALSRGTSIYLADRVIPMLHFKLSNGICSLNENEIRLTLTASITFNDEGVIKDYSIHKSFIKSVRRMTYNNCNNMLAGNKKVIKEYMDIYDTLLLMDELAKKIKEQRKKNGAIFFETSEIKFKFDTDGNPISLLKREQGPSESLIEEFMLSANTVVAKTLYDLNYPAIYRVHEEPDYNKLKDLEPILKSFDIKIRNVGSGLKSKDIQAALDKIKDTNYYYIVSTQMIRSMAKSCYMSECLGHFGLSLKYYCHFTSPIRRYPDLMVHRILHHLLLDKHDFNFQYNHFSNIVSDIALKNSISERKAMELERDVEDLEVCKFMKNKINQSFDGIINSITAYGAYVTLDNGVEGLAHVNYMADYMYYDDENKCLIGRDSDLCYNIGDSVRVRLIDINFSIRKLDFVILSSYKG